MYIGQIIHVHRIIAFISIDAPTSTMECVEEYKLQSEPEHSKSQLH